MMVGKEIDFLFLWVACAWMDGYWIPDFWVQSLRSGWVVEYSLCSCAPHFQNSSDPDRIFGLGTGALMAFCRKRCAATLLRFRCLSLGQS